MTRSAISNACDDLHECLRAAIQHAPGGVLRETERAEYVHSAARCHRLSAERLREYINTDGV